MKINKYVRQNNENLIKWVTCSISIPIQIPIRIMSSNEKSNIVQQIKELKLLVVTLDVLTEMNKLKESRNNHELLLQSLLHSPSCKDKLPPFDKKPIEEYITNVEKVLKSITNGKERTEKEIIGRMKEIILEMDETKLNETKLNETKLNETKLNE